MSGQTKTRADLVEMLSRSLGEEVAAASVGRAADTLHLGSDLSLVEALLVLETIANEPGLVGIAARFTKARAHMSWSTSRACTG